MQTPPTTWEKNSNLLTYILLGVILLQWVLNTYLLTWNTVTISGLDSLGVKKAFLELEYDKVGWKENYDLIAQANRLQLPEYLNQIQEYIATQWWAVPSDSTTNQGQWSIKSLKADEVKKITDNTYIEWNKEAKVLVIEYSEMECPYCSMQYHDTQVRENLKKQFGNTVSFAYKSNRGANHPGTETKALWLLCAGKLGWQVAYTKFYSYIMDKTTLRPSQRDGEVFPVDKLSEVAKYAWLDVALWKACLDKKETLSQFTQETSEAQSLWLNGTPWTLILNTETGKYDIVVGAAGYADFAAKVETLLK